MDESDPDRLQSAYRALRDGFPEALGLQVHRAISWIGRAGDEHGGGDLDARFLFLWIAFNAAYADERDLFDPATATAGERRRYASYFRRLVDLDADHRIYDAIWHRFSGPIRLLMQNPHVFQPFWSHRNGVPGCDDWEDRFAEAGRGFARALRDKDTARVLSFVFDRLYVLRNQIMHGGAAWNSCVNRDQLRDGAAILGDLMPVFVTLMMTHPHEDWGEPHYPLIAEARAPYLRV